MRPKTRRSLITAVVLVVACGVIAYGVRWWLLSRGHESTDDAYVDADVALITPRVDGTIVALPVSGNWQVKQGDLLARLDPAEYEVKLHEAEAAYAEAVQTIEQQRAAVKSADSQVHLAEAELAQAQLDFQRAAQLAKKNVVSTEALDRARTNLSVAESRLDAARQEHDRARAALGIALDAPADAAPTVRRAKAAREDAALMLSYTELRAPIAGIVTTRDVQLGQHVQPGQPLMRVVPIGKVYVEANFKETQLTDVRIGQPVTVVADIYPDYEYHGVVDGLAPGTGAAFALLPPENATGNWIKVVQRVPVKIRLNEPFPHDRPLRVGLSVVATIDVSDTSGPLLQPLSQRKGDADKGARAGEDHSSPNP